MIVSKILYKEELRIFQYNKRNVFFFEKQSGNLWTKLDTITLQPVWTKDLTGLNLNESDFYDEYILDGKGLLFDLKTNELFLLSNQIPHFRWIVSPRYGYGVFSTLEDNILKSGVYSLQSKTILWINELVINGLGFGVHDKNNISFLLVSKDIEGNNKRIIALHFLTGETLWQRSFKELGITNLDKFIGDIDNVLICACGKTILGLDKNTGEELWRVNHYTEVANAVLNQASGYIYLFYGWSGPENNFSENDNITFLEIEALTGEVLYDNSIFKHPNYIELNGLRHYEGTGDYPRFYNALQWKHKIYFLINSWHSSMVKIMEFDTVNKRISYLTEQSYEANANSNWFIAEGKLFIQSRISQQIESEENPDPSYWSKIHRKSQFDGEQMHYQYFAISKESYLTIFDLENN